MNPPRSWLGDACGGWGNVTSLVGGSPEEAAVVSAVSAAAAAGDGCRRLEKGSAWGTDGVSYTRQRSRKAGVAGEVWEGQAARSRLQLAENSLASVGRMDCRSPGKTKKVWGLHPEESL